MIGVCTTMSSQYMVTLLSCRVTVFFCNMAWPSVFAVHNVSGHDHNGYYGHRMPVCCPILEHQLLASHTKYRLIQLSHCDRAMTLGWALQISASAGTCFLSQQIGNDIWQKVYRAVTNTDCKGESWPMSDCSNQLTETHGMHNSKNQRI